MEDARPIVLPTVVLSIETSQQVYELLGRLMKSGKFGRTRADVAEELLRAKLREIELEGWLR